MKSIKICLMVCIMLLCANTIFATGHGLVNGSFEDDKRIIDISTREPNGWDVNVPVLQFGGLVDNLFGVTDGNWSLTLYSKYYKTFEVNDIAFVWQLVDLSDVNQIFFDVHLDTYGGVWNPAKRSAVVMIDEQVMWESPKTGSDIRGQYLNQVINLNYSQSGLHRFAIGIRADVKETAAIEYYTDWDNITVVVGEPNLPFEPEFVIVSKRRVGRTIFDYDCKVSLENLSPFTVRVTQFEIQSVPTNMTVIDSYVSDFEQIGAEETKTSADTCTFRVDRSELIDAAQIKWRVSYEIVNTCQTMHQASISMLKFELNLGDFNIDGQVDNADLVSLAEKWLWTGVPGSIQQDIVKDGRVDFLDFAIIAEHWLQ